MSEEKFCLQCGTPLILKSVAADPVYPFGPQAAACSTCGSRSYDVPGNKIKELTAQRDELLAALKKCIYCSEHFGPAYAGRDARDKAKALIKRIDHA